MMLLLITLHIESRQFGHFVCDEMTAFQNMLHYLFWLNYSCCGDLDVIMDFEYKSAHNICYVSNTNTPKETAVSQFSISKNWDK